MDWGLFPRGVVIGVSVAAPVGPMAVVCIRRTLSGGMLHGFISGLGIATADGIYGGIAALGLTSIATLLLDAQTAIRAIGGLFLIYLGIKTLRSAAPSGEAAADPVGVADHAGAYLSTLGLTLANPPTILAFAAIFAGFGVAEGSGAGLSAMPLVIGVVLGSAAWWLTITGLTSVFRSRLTPSRLTWLNRVSGAVIVTFGVVALATVFT